MFPIRKLKTAVWLYTGVVLFCSGSVQADSSMAHARATKDNFFIFFFSVFLYFLFRLCRLPPSQAVYTESGLSQTSDLNPDLHYHAAKEDPYEMKKKVVRGGSWKDVAEFIRSDRRTFEYQNETRSYIGFRCVRTQVGFSNAKGKGNSNKSKKKK